MSCVHTSLHPHTQVAAALIPVGTYKYVLLRAENQAGESRLLVRAYKGAGFHAEVCVCAMRPREGEIARERVPMRTRRGVRALVCLCGYVQARCIENRNLCFQLVIVPSRRRTLKPPSPVPTHLLPPVNRWHVGRCESCPGFKSKCWGGGASLLKVVQSTLMSTVSIINNAREPG